MKRVLIAIGLMVGLLGLSTTPVVNLATEATAEQSTTIHGTNAIGPYTIQATFTVTAAGTTNTTAVIPNGRGDIGSRPSGCGYYHRWINQYDSFGLARLYTYNHQLNWCWDGVSVYAPHVYYWGQIGDSSARYDGLVTGYPIDFYYNYSGWNGRSGFTSRTQAHFETDCVPRIGCFNNHYPWIHLYGHMNGSLHWSDAA